mmetsp:Transcript_115718/g.327239  ORF Transcript_115718/g.327239 Transcript_115718/m.327239 type:complete len:383 (-) Transcript_115718:701-1849(-)
MRAQTRQLRLVPHVEARELLALLRSELGQLLGILRPQCHHCLLALGLERSEPRRLFLARRLARGEAFSQVLQFGATRGQLLLQALHLCLQGRVAGAEGLSVRGGLLVLHPLAVPALDLITRAGVVLARLFRILGRLLCTAPQRLHRLFLFRHLVVEVIDDALVLLQLLLVQRDRLQHASHPSNLLWRHGRPKRLLLLPLLPLLLLPLLRLLFAPALLLSPFLFLPPFPRPLQLTLAFRLEASRFFRCQPRRLLAPALLLEAFLLQTRLLETCLLEARLFQTRLFPARLLQTFLLHARLLQARLLQACFFRLQHHSPGVVRLQLCLVSSGFVHAAQRLRLRRWRRRGFLGTWLVCRQRPSTQRPCADVGCGIVGPRRRRRCLL